MYMHVYHHRNQRQTACLHKYTHIHIYTHVFTSATTSTKHCRASALASSIYTIYKLVYVWMYIYIHTHIFTSAVISARHCMASALTSGDGWLTSLSKRVGRLDKISKSQLYNYFDCSKLTFELTFENFQRVVNQSEQERRALNKILDENPDSQLCNIMVYHNITYAL